MKASVFLEMTLHIFHSINIIKQLDPEVYKVEKSIDFKFKKNRKKLVIFDLDQTLINLERELQPGEDFKTLIGESSIPLVWIDIVTPSTGECIKTGFSIRPYAIECLK